MASKEELFERGRLLAEKFCLVNDIPTPKITSIPQKQWHFDACAYYRPQYIKVCVPKCAAPAAQSRCWSWPGATVDREPYGVVAHELGHHVDWLTGDKKGQYYSQYSFEVMNKSGEPPLTGYCPNPAEWFAEMFRLYLTNSELLANVRPRTHAILLAKFTPVVTYDWRKVLGDDCPERVVKAQRNKFAVREEGFT